MKKKILLIVLAIVIIGGGIVAYMAMTGGGATEEDNKQGEATADQVDKALDNADHSMPETDTELDTINTDGIIEEDFNPEDML